MMSQKHPGARFKHKTKCHFLRILSKSNSDPEADKALESILANKDLAEEDIVELIQVYLERGSDQSGNNEREKKILHIAFAGKMRCAVDLLMRKFSYLIDKLDEMGNSVTHHFVENEKQKFSEHLKPGSDHVQKLFSRKMEIETTSFVEWLIEKGFDFDRQNHEGKSPLLLCIEHNLQHISVALLKHSREIHSHNQQMQSLLHLFFEKNAEHRIECRSDERKEKWYDTYNSRYAADIVKILLDKGISAVALDICHRSPLYFAIKGRENVSIVELLINHSLQTNGIVTKVLVELLKSCAWWGESRTTYFVNILRNLISEGADVNVKAENGTTPAYWAFQAKNRVAVDFLSEHGADFGIVTEVGENLFHALAKKFEPSVKVSRDYTQEELFDLLMKKGRGYLHPLPKKIELWEEPNAVVQEKLVDFLADKGCCDVNAKTTTDEGTPLHLASKSGNLEVVRKFIEHGAEVDCRNTNQETPLHLAVHSHAEKVAELLLESGADVNSRDKCGLWPLYHASTSRKEPSMVPVLLKWGAYVNVKIDGESSFSRAISYDCWAEVKEMLAYGGDVNDNCVVSLVKSDSLTLEMRFYLMLHWLKLDHAKLPATTKYADIAHRYNNTRHRGRNLAEIEAMKKTLIDDCTSIYSFIHMNFGRRRVHVNDEKFKNFVNSTELKTQFPLYEVVIRACYHETVLWKSLLEPAMEGWLKVTGIQLPGECLELIFVHLRNEDLLGMIDYDNNEGN